MPYWDMWRATSVRTSSTSRAFQARKASSRDWRSLVSICFMVLLTSCGSRSGTLTAGPGGSLPTSSWTPGAVAQAAEVRGVLQGSAQDGGGCVWLGRPRGPRNPIVWPAGYTARFHPVIEILDKPGHVVARTGQTIEAGGGLNPVGKDVPCMFGHSEAFYIQSAVHVVGQTP